MPMLPPMPATFFIDMSRVDVVLRFIRRCLPRCLMIVAVMPFRCADAYGVAKSSSAFPLPSFIHSSGSYSSDICLIGREWNWAEERVGRMYARWRQSGNPYRQRVGSSGEPGRGEGVVRWYGHQRGEENGEGGWHVMPAPARGAGEMGGVSPSSIAWAAVRLAAKPRPQHLPSKPGCSERRKVNGAVRVHQQQRRSILGVRRRVL